MKKPLKLKRLAALIAGVVIILAMGVLLFIKYGLPSINIKFGAVAPTGP
jgi:hypothetical protein